MVIKEGVDIQTSRVVSRIVTGKPKIKLPQNMLICSVFLHEEKLPFPNTVQKPFDLCCKLSLKSKINTANLP